MRIGVIIARYSISGVPLAQARLAAVLAQAGHQVDYVVGYAPADLEVPEPEGTQRLILNAPTVRSALMPLCRYLRQARPDIIFSAEDHLNAAVAIAAIVTRSTVRISASSRVTPFDTYSDKRFSKRWALKKLVRATAWRQNVMTCVSRGTVEEYGIVMPSLTYHVAYNIVADANVEALLAAPLDDPWLPALGRSGAAGMPPVVVAACSLESWKGVDDLVRAVSILRERGRLVRLIVLGEGSQRSVLENLIGELGLSAQVRLPGRETNPYRFFRRASAFALCSHVESFGNVLVEAMLAGATPVATDCPTGPREVLQDGAYGYLVQPRDPASIADGLIAALDHPIAPERLAKGIKRFTEAAVLARHSELLGMPLLATGDEGKRADVYCGLSNDK